MCTIISSFDRFNSLILYTSRTAILCIRNFAFYILFIFGKFIKYLKYLYFEVLNQNVLVHDFDHIIRKKEKNWTKVFKNDIMINITLESLFHKNISYWELISD